MAVAAEPMSLWSPAQTMLSQSNTSKKFRNIWKLSVGRKLTHAPRMFDSWVLAANVVWKLQMLLWHQSGSNCSAMTRSSRSSEVATPATMPSSNKSRSRDPSVTLSSETIHFLNLQLKGSSVQSGLNRAVNVTDGTFFRCASNAMTEKRPSMAFRLRLTEYYKKVGFSSIESGIIGGGSQNYAASRLSQGPLNSRAFSAPNVNC